VAKFYSARSKTISPLPWQTFALPFSQLVQLHGLFHLDFTDLPALSAINKGQSGNMLRCRQRNYYATSVANFCTAFLIWCVAYAA
jgi:hypothetical protein